MNRLALVWNAPVRLTEITTRFEPYVEGLAAIGISTVTVCPAGTEVGYPHPVHTFASDGDIAKVGFWNQLDCQAGVMITWHRMTDIMLAMRSCGMKVLAITDSDGQQSHRHHPWATFRFSVFQQPTYRGKLGACRQWLKTWLFDTEKQQRALMENVAAADVTTFAMEGCLESFRKFLADIRAEQLGERLAWLPYPVWNDYCERPIFERRGRRIIAVGRWESVQKNPDLLEAVARKISVVNKPVEVLIVGSGAERFAGLEASHSFVKVLGRRKRDELAGLMSECRCLLVTSRWESGPIVANEMLALGGTVVGTPIPSIVGITADGRFGRVSRNHHADSLTKAVLDEMDVWDRGERNPGEIANNWRLRISPCGVAVRMLQLLGLSAN